LSVEYVVPVLVESCIQKHLPEADLDARYTSVALADSTYTVLTTLGAAAPP
jgi:hypothetical protein